MFSAQVQPFLRIAREIAASPPRALHRHARRSQHNLSENQNGFAHAAYQVSRAQAQSHPHALSPKQAPQAVRGACSIMLRPRRGDERLKGSPRAAPQKPNSPWRPATGMFARAV
jgi:hypothetical protein